MSSCRTGCWMPSFNVSLCICGSDVQICQGKAAVCTAHLQLLAARQLAQHRGGRHAVLWQREQECTRADEPAALHSRQWRPLHIRNQALCRNVALQSDPQLFRMSVGSDSWHSTATAAMRSSGSQHRGMHNEAACLPSRLGMHTTHVYSAPLKHVNKSAQREVTQENSAPQPVRLYAFW